MTDVQQARHTIDKVVRPGAIPDYDGKRIDVFCRIQYDGQRLSVTGVEGPRSNGEAYGSAGQIVQGYARRDPADNDSRYRDPRRPEDFSFADGWDVETWLRFVDVWDRWHLNDMRAECEHQRALGWTYATHAGQDCPECGYPIGSQWLYEDVPEDVLAFLGDLPDADRVPAWV